jgi:hypothetical protein
MGSSSLFGMQERRVHMDKFIPYEKLSKKEKRKADSSKRNTWGAFSPITRKPENSRAYNRASVKRQDLKDA